MSQVSAMLRHAAEVQNRLRYPPNRVTDHGIDLKRRGIPKMADDPKPTLVHAAFVLPYAIGSFTPHYKLTYNVPYRRPDGALTIRTIQRAVCYRFDIKLADMLSERRTWSLVRPRQIAMYLAKELTGKSLPELGRRFGDRDHTTVLHAIRKIARLRQSDAQVNSAVVELSAVLLACPVQFEETPCSSPPTPEA